MWCQKLENTCVMDDITQGEDEKHEDEKNGETNKIQQKQLACTNKATT